MRASSDSEQGLEDSHEVIGTIDLDGDTLESNTYYRSRDPRDVETRRKLAYEMFSSFTALGFAEDDAAREAPSALLIESAYAPMSPAALAKFVKFVPDFDWNAYYDAFGLDAELLHRRRAGLSREDESPGRALAHPHRHASAEPLPPNCFRVDGTVADLQPFYAALGVVPANRMYRPFDERCSLW